MNISPAGPELKRYAKGLIGAASVEHAIAAQGVVEEQALQSAEELELEPGSRTVTESEVRNSTGKENEGWRTAAFKEYQESFLEMQAITVSTPQEVAAAGGPSRALPMKLVWVQKPEKKKCRAVVCGNFEEKDPTEQVWTAQAETSSVMAGLRLAQLEQWDVGKVDVKGAFMYDPLYQRAC